MLPQQIQNVPRPKGFYTSFKQWPITPLSSNMYWKADDIARFLININQGVMDPYRSHIQFTIQVNQQMQPVGGLQIDSSAQSFISQTVVSSNQVQIQRMTQYDTLAALLTDMGFSQYVCQTRQTQGLGYSNIQSHKPWTNKTSGMSTNLFYGAQNGSWPIMSVSNSGLILPTQVPFRTGLGNTDVTDNKLDNNFQSPWQYWGQSGVATPSNPIWNTISANLPIIPTIPSIIQNMGRLQNVRFQYVDHIMKRDYPDGCNTKVMTSPQVKNQTWNWGNIGSVGFNQKNPYHIDFVQKQFVRCAKPYQTGIIQVQNSCSVMGFQKAICPQFCRGTNQAMLSATIPQVQMQNGILLRQKVPLTRKTFRLPLLSSICGALIPPDQFTLIPMQALNNLLLQITLSRYAMFTTGYQDVHQLDYTGMQKPQQRKWLVTNIQWNLHLYTFGDQRVNQYIKATLSKPLQLTATGYSLCSQFQLPNGQVVRNSWPIGCQYQDLCQIYCVFIPNDYQTKSFCRKQFRISNNITSMQIKLDTNFYPTQPIIGNGGNPQKIDSTGDNWPYYQLILLSTNRLFSINHPYPKINPRNFAINQRCYNVNNQNTLYDKKMYGADITYKFNQQSVNMDTAMGMSSFHQNRYVGKAVYVFTWQPYGHSNQYLSGVNTSGVRNFQITFNSSPINPFPRDQTLMIFARYNQLIQYTNNGIQVFGK